MEFIPGDAVVGELLGDEVAGHALQGLQGQLARVVYRHAVSGEAQLELEGDLRGKKTMTSIKSDGRLNSRKLNARKPLPEGQKEG